MAHGVYKRTPEHIKRLKEVWNNRSQENKNRFYHARKGKPMSQNHKDKIKNVLLGKPKSIKARNNMSKAQKGIKHAPFTEEHKKKIARFGKEHWAWKGGGGSVGCDRRKSEEKAGRPRSEACEICSIPAKDLQQALHYDHDHVTNLFRGWLCSRCNLALGMVKDNKEILQAMIEYLIKNQT